MACKFNYTGLFINNIFHIGHDIGFHGGGGQNRSEMDDIIKLNVGSIGLDDMGEGIVQIGPNLDDKINEQPT